MIKKINSALYGANIGFKSFDSWVDLLRLMREPTSVQLEKMAYDIVCLYGMYFGVNVQYMIVGGIEVVYQINLGKYDKAFEVTVDMVNTIGLPYILLSANRPYLGFTYGALVVMSTAHDTISNAYSFALEIASSDAILKSKVAYKQLTERLALSPLQALYDFNLDIKEYELQINSILFEHKKLAIKSRLQEQGESGQKLFTDVTREGLMEEKKAEALNLESLTINFGSKSYDHCMKAKIRLPYDEEAEQYYCYNLEKQVIDHIAIVGGNSIEVLEKHEL